MNTKISEVENKIPDVSGLVTTTLLNTKIGDVENKIPDASGLAMTTDYNTKIKDIEVILDILDAKVKQKNWMMNVILLILWIILIWMQNLHC